MNQQDGQETTAGVRDVRICGSRLVLRALRPGEIDEEWRAMVTADPMAIAQLPDEASFKARLQRSGRLEDGWLDLAIDSGFQRAGWMLAGSLTEFGREWVMYRITRREWETR